MDHFSLNLSFIQWVFYNQTYFWKNIQFKSQNQGINVFKVYYYESSNDKGTASIYDGTDGLEGTIIGKSADL